jgi:N utilization substance protein B
MSSPKNKLPKSKRSRESRETGFLLLFEWSFGYAELGEIIEAAKEAGREEPDPYALKLARRTIENSAALDELIERYSQGWKLNRLSRALLTILRMALCEMTLMTGVPAGVSINEAVELLKKYASKDDAAYLNGVLGAFEQVRKGLKPEPPKPEKPLPEPPEPPESDSLKPPEFGEPQTQAGQAPAEEEASEPSVELIEGFDFEIE